MAKLFIPDYYTEDLTKVAWKAMREQGIVHVYLDIDNTLEPQGARVAGPRTAMICEAIEAAGMGVSILSNAAESRAEEFCQPLNLDYLGLAAKPLVHKIKGHMKVRSLKADQVLLVGDQIFTDLWCARFLGCPVLLQDSLGGKETGFLAFKRKLEALLVKLGQDPKKAAPAPLA
ncbi:MAG: hypothetical protein Q4E09_01700 [Eubacteriales bacterium]|nr:hypothetical protein [Eubacteriales bacterium]